MTLLQAVSAGVLPVVTNIPGCTEMLRFKDDYTFQRGDVDARQTKFNYKPRIQKS